MLEVRKLRVLCAMALGITLTIAGAAPASAGGPNDLFTVRGHPEADASWTTCPEGPSSLDEVCVDTGVKGSKSSIRRSRSGP